MIRQDIKFDKEKHAVFLGKVDKVKDKFVGKARNITGKFYSVLCSLIPPNSVRAFDTIEYKMVIMNAVLTKQGINDAIKFFESEKAKLPNSGEIGEFEKNGFKKL